MSLPQEDIFQSFCGESAEISRTCRGKRLDELVCSASQVYTRVLLARPGRLDSSVLTAGTQGANCRRAPTCSSVIATRSVHLLMSDDLLEYTGSATATAVSQPRWTHTEMRRRLELRRQWKHKALRRYLSREGSGSTRQRRHLQPRRQWRHKAKAASFAMKAGEAHGKVEDAHGIEAVSQPRRQRKHKAGRQCLSHSGS